MVNVRAAVTTLVEVVGIGLVSFGFWLIMPALGIIAVGIGLVLIGWRLA